jgi:hypothetical protein
MSLIEESGDEFLFLMSEDQITPPDVSTEFGPEQGRS